MQNGRDGEERRHQGAAAGRLARDVAARHAELLARLREEVGDGERFAAAAARLAEEFGAVTATAVEAAHAGAAPPLAEAERGPRPVPRDADLDRNGDEGHRNGRVDPETEYRELASLYRPGHMRRRLEQLLETNRRYGHPFGLALFDASGPGTREKDAAGSAGTVLSILGVALRDSIRIVDEAFRLEEDAICVLAPNLRTVEGVQMAERLLGQLEELERAGGLRISVAAGVVACPDHGEDADELLQQADMALWRARAVGQPVGVGRLQDR